jgi:hypothetical protein
MKIEKASANENMKSGLLREMLEKIAAPLPQEAAPQQAAQQTPPVKESVDPKGRNYIKLIDWNNQVVFETNSPEKAKAFSDAYRAKTKKGLTGTGTRDGMPFFDTYDSPNAFKANEITIL